MFPRAFRIGSVGGVDVRIDPSWLLIAALVALSFWGRFSQLHGHPPAVAIVLGIVATLLFFGSVLAHELGHALEATHRDVHVAGITLFLFGGVTETRFDVERPRDEFALSAVGPYVSFVLGAAFGIVAALASAMGLDAVADVSGLLGWLNILLGVFNLLPGAPLDGGRVLRSIIWAITGDRRRAIRGAARSGQVVGSLILAVGVWLLFGLGRFVDGLWFAVIGWFLLRAAAAELEQAEQLGMLESRVVGDICDPPEWFLPPDATVADVIGDVTRSSSDVHAVGDDDDVVGLVLVEDLAAVPRDRRDRVSLREVARGMRDVPTVTSDTPLADAIDHLRSSPVVAVVDGGELAGLITEDDLERTVRRLRTLHGEPKRRRRREHLPGDR